MLLVSFVNIDRIRYPLVEARVFRFCMVIQRITRSARVKVVVVISPVDPSRKPHSRRIVVPMVVRANAASTRTPRIGNLVVTISERKVRV